MMHYRQLLLDIGDAFRGLRRRPLRSLLSSLGIGIGVTALIAMLSISEGARQKALAKITSLGTDTIRIEDAVSAARKEQQRLANLSVGLTEKDAGQVEARLGDRGVVGSFVRQDDIVVSMAGKAATVTVLGVSWEWFVAEKLHLSWGRFFDEHDEAGAASYFVLGNGVARELGAVGGTLSMEEYAGRIVGILAPRGRLLTEGTGLSSLDFDRCVIMPLTAMPYGRVELGRKVLDGLVISLKKPSEQQVLRTGQAIREHLLEQHRMVEDFRLVIPVSLLREARESQRLFSLIMGAIAGLSLLVGGIGVMNVMLANISEQTREIGLRMSLGASRGRIVWYYLWNSMLLTLSGGIWGTGAGIVAAWVIQKYAGWDVAFSSPALLIAPVAALLTGILFGLHPAVRAASLDPAVALRES